jgi:hypothetical protein
MHLLDESGIPSILFDRVIDADRLFSKGHVKSDRERGRFAWYAVAMRNEP